MHGLRIAAAVSVAALVVGATAAAAATSTDVQANHPQVRGVPASDSTAVFPTNKQNEPTIAVDPTNPLRLIAGSNDEQDQPPCGPGPVRGAGAAPNDCSFFPGVGTDGVYTSSDGGQTWTNQGLLDDQASWQGRGVVSDGDPVLAFGPKPNGTGGFDYTHGARAYYVSLASIAALKGQEFIVVSSSDDDGVTWSAPVLATTKQSPADFNDKNWITVDDQPSSPFFGRVYVSWTEFRSKTVTGFGNEPVDVTYSTDGGNTFAPPNQLSPAGNNGTGNGRQGSSVTTGPDGSVYVAFEQGSGQVVSISRNGGVKWSRPATIGAVTDISDPIPGANFRTDSFPTIAADPRVGSTTLHAAWVTRTSAGGRVVVASSSDKGATWSVPTTVSGATEGYAFFQGLDVAPNGRVDVAYQALVTANPATFGTGNASIDSWYVSKPANGAWSSPVRVTSAPSDPAASAQNNLARQFWGDYNTLVSGNDRAWFIFTDSRRGVGCPAVDAYQHFLVDNGLAVPSDDDDEAATRGAKQPAAPDPSVKPAPETDCGSQFGNTDVQVAVITP